MWRRAIGEVQALIFGLIFVFSKLLLKHGQGRVVDACGERTAGLLCLRLIYDFFRAKRVYTAQYIVAFASCLGCLRFGKLPAANPQASRLACIFAF